MDDIKQVLLSLGFSNISDLGKEYRARPIYRDSDNSTVLSIKKDSGLKPIKDSLSRKDTSMIYQIKNTKRYPKMLSMR